MEYWNLPPSVRSLSPQAGIFRKMGLARKGNFLAMGYWRYIIKCLLNCWHIMFIFYVWHLCFLKMWHGKGSNPCAYSVKEMFLNGKRTIVIEHRSHAIDYSTEVADDGGCPGGVYTCMLSYAETELVDISIACKFPFRSRPVVRKMPHRRVRRPSSVKWIHRFWECFLFTIFLDFS